ncbi:MAG: hypothetical protein KJP19_05660 [Deltaproteobacteria bacterium]|nr:hypothetical protein [Deltaproteobacteria bacterium]MBT8361148.1 hypothetical protein [Deltaproteobacteria bacterium]
MGILALMGSGELTATMVEVHKMLLSRFRPSPSALFLNTPAGFQLNADQIGANAVDYFRQRVGCRMEVASYKSSDTISEVDAAVAYQKLRGADFILMGPGSPTYTVQHLRTSLIPEIFTDHINRGGCLVAASAAALTAGCFTLPVYELYKVGQPPHWVEGLDILGAFGLSLVVIPHWNNAEGGTHDTSRCFMGASRFDQLVSLLEEPLPILGLDEHTACIIDFEEETFEIYGIGTVVLQHNGTMRCFAPGRKYPLAILQGSESMSAGIEVVQLESPVSESKAAEDSDFWQQVHRFREDFQQGITADDVRQAAHALLELDRLLWQAHGDMETPETIAQARDLFREQLAELGTRAGLTRSALLRVLDPIVDSLLAARQHFRDARQFEAGDALRDALSRAGILVEDTADGYRWRIGPSKEEDDDRTP